MAKKSVQLPMHCDLPLSQETSQQCHHSSSTAAPSEQNVSPAPQDGFPRLVKVSNVPSVESQCFMITGMAVRSSSQNPICTACASQMKLYEVHRCQVIANARRAAGRACVVCLWKQGDPGAFTWPYLHFMTENPTAFHVVNYCREKLSAASFEELAMREDWSSKLQPGGKYFLTRNGSTLAAFTIGGAYKPGNGVAIVAGHIDALTAKLKPVSTKPSKAGYIQLGVAPYAGALNETWWDRDLGIGGRVVVRDPETGKTGTQLVNLGWPIAKIPTLAPHFGVSMIGQGNRETQLVPVIGLGNGNAPGYTGDSDAPIEPALGPAGSFVASQPPKLVKLIASELGITSYTSIVNWELELFDTQPATLVGLDKELISAGRIDDKICSWAALMALLRAKNNDESSVIRMVALFDDEEIGSLLRQGAKSNFLPLTIERIVESFCSREDVGSSFGPGVLAQTYAASFLVSSDVTHAANPNFMERYLEGHAPKLNVGVALAHDSNGHMTTDSVSTAQLQRVAELSGSTLQRFMIRNDSRSGGTIGPSLSSALGIKSADAGIPQLSMHSIRATVGSLDPGLGVRFFQGFLEQWERVDGEWQ